MRDCRVPSVRRRVAVVALAALAVIGFGASPASAHASLDSSDPSPSAVLDSAPSEIFLDFNEPVTPQDGAVELVDQTGAAVPIDDAVVSPDDPTVVVAGGVPDLADGLYVVAWRVVSSDGHVAQGAFTFEVGVGGASVDAGALVGDILSGRSAASGIGLGLDIARFLAYFGAIAALSGLAFLGALANVRAVRRLIGGGLVVLVIGSLAHFLLQGSFSAGGSWSDAFDSNAWSNVLDTRLGQSLIVRLVLACLLVVLMLGSAPTPDDDRRARLTTSWWRSSTALVGAGVVVTFSAASHASASSPAGVAVAVDALHMSAIVLWVGGLFAVVAARNLDVVPTLSRVSTIAMPLAVATGVWQTWHLGGGLTQLSDTEWGRWLLVKVALAVVVITLGFVARLVISHAAEPTDAEQLAADDERRRRGLRRLMAVEVAVAVLVLGATATLVAESPEVQAAPNIFSSQLIQGDLIADITVTPGNVGSNEIHVSLSPSGGTLQRMESVTMRMTYPDPSLPPVAVQVTESGPNHYIGRVALLSAGTWTLEVLVQPDPSRSIRFATDVPITG
ncbi:MAG: hypothetical protein B7C54_02025 [Acidimicrobiales bacterium mtb01]|nr:hypothetical protein [Actinomycetota bacterium]TEX47864.1 MAG: hypothetical protein B7C54_02025 [Acidimicrobiales bacterium mtb01]